MNLKGLSGGIYRPLSLKDIEILHDASLTILEKTEFRFEDGLDETIDLLEANGAAVDRDHARIFLPRDLVMAQVLKAREQVILYSRDGENNLDLTQHRVYLGTGGAAIKILDLETGEARPSTLKGLYQLARSVDSLDHIHGPASCRRDVQNCHMPVDLPGGAGILESMRTEYFSGNDVTDQNSRENWEQNGAHDTRTRAREIAKNIIAGGKSYIPARVEEAIREKYEILL